MTSNLVKHHKHRVRHRFDTFNTKQDKTYVKLIFSLIGRRLVNGSLLLGPCRADHPFCQIKHFHNILQTVHSCLMYTLETVSKFLKSHLFETSSDLTQFSFL